MLEKINLEEKLHLLCMLWANEASITSENGKHFLTLKNTKREVLYSTSRPVKARGFVDEKKFMSVWIDNNDAFLNEPPEISFEYNKIHHNSDGIANSVAIDLLNPMITKENAYQFLLTFRDEIIPDGKYDNVVLFIDWIPTAYCPKPIGLFLPELDAIYK
ncbi:MAG: hypothetical protein Q8L78_07105 [Coxiellaceae bacterium]|nr:hypothetical protein [Coxiellaceae bacterium]